ncbi:lactoylglutathione lyase [Sphingopyxis sp. 113P3]|uniref:lactoylglutathione lyase n=1 Tax=Sphingopyxis sp. (strain 113P3) TaxID=292913 RepID=UPI001F46D571|nr:lactoylglutathione lyase [Sphingopyxis sp. 113P3]
MLRVRDPAASLEFYRGLLGMSLLDRYDFPDLKFSLYFLGFVPEAGPADRAERVEWVFGQPALLELTHNWGSEADPEFHYHDGNAEPRGFGHIGLSVPDVEAVCAGLGKNGVEFVKRPQDGAMKGIAFVKDPDGYWVELLSPASLRNIIMAQQQKS